MTEEWRKEHKEGEGEAADMGDGKGRSGPVEW